MKQRTLWLILTVTMKVVISHASSQHKQPADLLTYPSSVHPVGPLMCKELCRQMSGCSSTVFDASKLICQMTNSTDDLKEVDIYHANATNMSFCEERVAHIACRTNRDYNSVPARLFPSPFRSRSDVMYQLFLHNNTLLPYSYLSMDRVIAIALMSTTSTLYLANITIIILNDLDSHKVCYINRRKVFAMAAEENLQQMGTTEQNVQRVFFNRQIISVALDSKRNFVFATTNLGLIRAAYEGQKVKVITNRGKMALTFDPEGNVVYYNTGKTIYKVDMLGFKPQNVVDLQLFWPRCIVSKGHRVYNIGILENSGIVGFIEKPEFTLLQMSESNIGCLCTLIP